MKATFDIEAHETEADWLAARLTGIGASEAPVLMGLTSWSSPLALWAEKTGLAEPAPAEFRMKMGQRLEPIVAELFTEETGRKLYDPGPYTIHRDRERPWLLASIDRTAKDAKRGPGVVELKAADTFMAPEWAEGVPAAYFCQVQHQLAVTGYRWGALAVLIGGTRDFRYLDPIERDETYIEALLYIERQFWQHVVEREQPAPGRSLADADVLRRLHPEEVPGTSVELTGKALEWDDQRGAAALAIKQAEGEKREAENNLRAAIGDAEVGVLPNGVSYTWKLQQKKEHIVKASSSRVLRRRKAKG